MMVSNKLVSMSQKEVFDDNVDNQCLQDINVMIVNVVSDSAKVQNNDICNDKLGDVKQSNACNEDNKINYLLFKIDNVVDNVL